MNKNQTKILRFDLKLQGLPIRQSPEQLTDTNSNFFLRLFSFSISHPDFSKSHQPLGDAIGRSCWEKALSCWGGSPAPQVNQVPIRLPASPEQPIPIPSPSPAVFSNPGKFQESSAKPSLQPLPSSGHQVVHLYLHSLTRFGGETSPNGLGK